MAVANVNQNVESAKITWLGAILRRMREHRGWNVARLAEISGVDKSIISRLERGEARTAHDRTLQALARALEVDAAVLKSLGQRPVAPPPESVLHTIGQSLGEPQASVSPHRAGKVADAILALSVALTAEGDKDVWRETAVVFRRLADVLDRMIAGDPTLTGSAQETLAQLQASILPQVAVLPAALNKTG